MNGTPRGGSIFITNQPLKTKLYKVGNGAESANQGKRKIRLELGSTGTETRKWKGKKVESASGQLSMGPILTERPHSSG